MATKLHMYISYSNETTTVGCFAELESYVYLYKLRRTGTFQFRSKCTKLT